jgi:D-arabinose 1-dehydrogenase-like Zn-dependent alcohol dehydrogenase
MKAAVMVAQREPLEIREMPDPTPGPHDAVVRVEAEGICRSDWHAWMGDWSWIGFSPQLPIIPGHELGGVVEAVGSEVRSVQVGDRVTVPFHEGCGRCTYCLGGRPNLCDNPQVLGFSHDGGYAQFVRVPNAEFNCIKLPEGVESRVAAAIGCRYMTGYHAVTRQGQIRPGQWVAVHGAGGVGLSAIQVANAAGAQVIAVDIDDAKLQKAMEEGAIATLNARTEDVPAAIKEITRGGAHVSIDALGISDTVTNSILCLRKGGRHVQVGLTTQNEHGMVALPVDAMVVMELEFVGSLGNPHPDYAGLLALVERGKLQPQSLITRDVALEEASDVLRSMTDFKTVGFNVITAL